MRQACFTQKESAALVAGITGQVKLTWLALSSDLLNKGCKPNWSACRTSFSASAGIVVSASTRKSGNGGAGTAPAL